MAYFPTKFPLSITELLSLFPADTFNPTIDALASLFYGTEEPLKTYPAQLRGNATSGELQIRKTDNSGWLRLAKLDREWGGLLPLAGGVVMEGLIDMGGFGIVNLPLGSGNAPARYADLALYAKLDGSVAFTGLPVLPIDPSLTTHAARKAYVDAAAKAGGAFTGIISLPFAPTVGDHVTRKAYVDGEIQTHAHTGAGAGVKLEAASALKATSIAASRMFTTDGVGGTAWTAHQPLRIYAKPKVVARHPFNSGNFPTVAVGWSTLVDISADVTAGAKFVLLLVRLYVQSGFDTGNLAFRPGGSTTAFADAIKVRLSAPDDASVPPALGAFGAPALNDTGAFWAWVELDSQRRFDWLTDLVGSNNNYGAAFWLIGES